MTGLELDDGVLRIDRAPNELDRLAIAFTALLDELGIEHVYVSEYVAILAGRARATEDIDVLVDRPEDEVLDRLVERLDAAGFWGPAMPLETIHDLGEATLWVARDGELVPHLDVQYVTDRFDRASLEHRLVARLETVAADLPIGPLELQIAYKLWMGARTDVEDAVHLHRLFEASLRPEELEAWVETFGVEEAYDRLTGT